MIKNKVSNRHNLHHLHQGRPGIRNVDADTLKCCFFFPPSPSPPLTATAQLSVTRSPETTTASTSRTCVGVDLLDAHPMFRRVFFPLSFPRVYFCAFALDPPKFREFSRGGERQQKRVHADTSALRISSTSSIPSSIEYQTRSYSSLLQYMTLKFPFRNPAWSKKGAVATKELDRLNVMTGGSLVDDDYVDTPAAKTDDDETLGSLGRPGVISTALDSMDTSPIVWGQPSPKVSTDNAINRLIRSAALSFDDDALPIPTTPVATTAFTTATATPRRCGSTMPQMKLPPTTITMCKSVDTNHTEYPNEEVVIADYDQGKYLDRTSTKDTATMDSWSLQTASDCCHVGEEIQLADTLDPKEEDTLESSSKEDTLESNDDNKVDIVTATADTFHRASTKETATMDSWSLQTASDCCHVGEEIQLANTLDPKEEEDTLESSTKEDTFESNEDNKVDIVTTTTTVTSPPVVCVCDESSVLVDYDQFYDQGKEILYLGRTSPPSKDTATMGSWSLQTAASDCCHVDEADASPLLLEKTTTSYTTSSRACAATQTDLDRITTVLRDRTQALKKVRDLLEREQKQGKDRKVVNIYIYMVHTLYPRTISHLC